jgi:multidrug efflux pump subunit AcrB
LRKLLIAAGVQALLDSALKLDKDTTWAGMAMTIVFGLTFAAPCTVVVMPALYAKLDRFYQSIQATRKSS